MCAHVSVYDLSGLMNRVKFLIPINPSTPVMLIQSMGTKKTFTKVNVNALAKKVGPFPAGAEAKAL